MANDPDPDPDDDLDPDPDVGPDDDHLRDLIREEIRAALEGFTPSPSGGPDADAPVTVKGVEEATERAVRKAMDELTRKAAASRKKAPPKKKAPEPEPAPVNPPKGIIDKIREAAWS